MTTTTYTNMGKEELRAACRAAGISYGKLNNDGMRDALATISVETEAAPVTLGGFSVFNPVPVAVTPDANATVVQDGKVVDPAAAASTEEEGKNEWTWNSRCPLCYGNETNQIWATEDVSRHCHECNKTYSISTRREIRTGYTRANVVKGYKIEKDRPMHNGVKRPSSGTLCGSVWAALDTFYATKGMPLAIDLPALADANGWNKNNVMCEFYAWRKFNGIAGRQSRGEAAVKDAGK